MPAIHRFDCILQLKTRFLHKLSEHELNYFFNKIVVFFFTVVLRINGLGDWNMRSGGES